MRNINIKNKNSFVLILLRQHQSMDKIESTLKRVKYILHEAGIKDVVVETDRAVHRNIRQL